MSFDVREAEPADAAAVAALSEVLGYAGQGADMAARIELAREDTTRVVYLAVDEVDVVLGWIELQRVDVLVSEPYALIAGLVVDAGVRGRGIGRALVTRAEAWARASGLDLLRLRTRTTRPGAHAFYERLGFTCTKEQRCYVRELGEPGAR